VINWSAPASYNAIFIVPISNSAWMAPINTSTSSPVHAYYSLTPVATIDSIWKSPASMFAPNKPVISVSQVANGLKITHVNDTTKYDLDYYLYFNTSNNYNTSRILKKSDPSSDAPGVSWSDTSETSPDGVPLTSITLSLGAIQENVTYWFWFRTSNIAIFPDPILSRFGEISDFSTGTLLSGTYTLTINGALGGTVTGPNCDGIASGSICVSDPSPSYGSQIPISFVASDGYVVGDVLIAPAIPYNLSVSDNQHHNITFTNYTNLTIAVTPTFVSAPCQLDLSIDTESYTNAKGKIKLDSPNLGDVYSTSNRSLIIENPNVNSPVIISANPNYNYQVKEWVVDGVVDSSSTGNTISVSIAGEENKTVSVRFEEFVGTYYDLTIEASGSGGTSPLSGQYISGQTIAINPVPAPGWVFTGWVYPLGGPDFSIAGNTLSVTMSGDKSGIVATFEQEVVASILRNETATIFYCSSETYRDNIVSFSFINNSEDPSVEHNYHFRLNFYTDITKDRLVYSAFSLADNKRWFLNDGTFSQLSSGGLNVEISDTVNIIYDPEALPQQTTETQKPHLLNNNSIIYEKPLICGVKYYVEVQAYEVSSNTLTTVETIPLILDCDKVDSYYWNYNQDKNNWLCSGQGKADLQVSSGYGTSINPSIASNLFGIFKIVWQGRKTSVDSNIYAAVWDSVKDILYSSGQGLYDVLEIINANHPIITTDPALNFYISGTVKDNIIYKACSFDTCGDSASPGASPGSNNFEAFCYPGSAANLSGVYDQIKMRVYEEDISDSLVINDEKVVPVISQKSIRLDVDGIVGAYAVRLRNMEDREWGEWINIDNDLSGAGTGDDASYSAYRIDNSRFIVPWNIEKHNGLRRICCQVLTIYGISNTFCLEVLANFDVPQHIFKFYTADTRLSGLSTDSPPGNEFPTYNGQYVLSLDAPGVTINPEGYVNVYFDAVFSEPVYKDEEGLISYTIEDVKYNVIQQGVNDLVNQSFTTVIPSKFSGQFKLYNNDGIFNKDGAAFIEILFPDTTVAESCGSDDRDIYNIVNADLEQIANINLLPEEVYQKYQSNKLSKSLDIDRFKQNYDKDDTNFKFGNPGYYRK